MISRGLFSMGLRSLRLLKPEPQLVQLAVTRHMKDIYDKGKGDEKMHVNKLQMEQLDKLRKKKIEELTAEIEAIKQEINDLVKERTSDYQERKKELEQKIQEIIQIINDIMKILGGKKR
ncbi:uncharacterized protein Dwil_GK26837 [Drosophila willistoni]|uniref:Uncharacterized protein n=2 Tax=Drosophila willistoni TaxID=7260 RepID=A0A0Q9WW08_DROWI|nr:uncharacterized protein Dwil_GK26837 [Drosophila willistoni]